MRFKLILAVLVILTLSSSWYLTAKPKSHHIVNTPSLDQRIIVLLEDKQRAFVLGHMRHMLETLTSVQQHMLNNEPEKVHEAVQKMQQNNHENRPKRLGKSFPAPFRAMSKQMNKHWHNLSVKSTDTAFIQKEVVNVMTTCNACHNAYQIDYKRN